MAGRFITALALPALLFLAGCHLVFEYSSGDFPDGGSDKDAAHEGLVPPDGSPGNDQPPIPEAGLVKRTIRIVDTKGTKTLAIGAHITLRATVTPPASALTYDLRAAPCLLKVKGVNQSPRRLLNVSKGDPVNLILFVPPDATPGATCTLSTSTAGFTVQADPVKVSVAAYRKESLDGVMVNILNGLTHTVIGDFKDSSNIVRALSYTGGGFGGGWVAAVSSSPSSRTAASSVKLHRFTTTPSSTIAAWLDLAGKTVDPLTVRDMIWSSTGACYPSQDALYIAAAGSVVCIHPDQSIKKLYGYSSLSLDVSPLSTFHSGGSKDELFVFTGKIFTFPGGKQITGLPVPHTYHLRFARGGPHRGHMYVIAAANLSPMTRIAPKTHQVTSFGDLKLLGDTDDFGTMVLNHSGSFGELVVVPRRIGNGDKHYDLVAMFAAGGKTRELRLIKNLRCGRRIAFDAAGQRLAVVTSEKSTCFGEKTARVFEFKLP